MVVSLRKATDDPAPEYATTRCGLHITVDKDGGGTLGRAYDGTWTVSVMNGPVFVFDNEEIRTGTPKTHVQVAHIAYQYACWAIDDA